MTDDWYHLGWKHILNEPSDDEDDDVVYDDE